ncbi:hypothetical protein H5410_038400 [Solanum commersonii]|uniref:Protein NUCLEAR FUSION DEFECTIVE 6, chloroplastic/mitochondrial-like n=1 Tax=Solanum commersonii TaxID=4109 RepID=A0A9J5YC70_SOLCO|nr:hypothetical protein H5410_038400 [Solanum commersonii]
MAIAAARSIFRSPSLRNAASRIASEAKAARSPLRTPSKSPLSHRIFRCPSEMSACLESLQPYHTVTASALMTSMLTDSLRSYSWLSEGDFSLYCYFFFDNREISEARSKHYGYLARPIGPSFDVLSSFTTLALTRLDEEGEA